MKKRMGLIIALFAVVFCIGCTSEATTQDANNTNVISTPATTQELTATPIPIPSLTELPTELPPVESEPTAEPETSVTEAPEVAEPTEIPEIIVPTATATPEATPTATPTSAPTATPTPKPTATPTPKPTATPTPKPTATPTPKPTTTPTPKPTTTPTPTPTNTAIYEGTTVALSEAKVGDVVLFGTYEQDNIESNGVEAIPWYVLDKDGDKLLLLSVYLLDSVPYHEEWESITWEDCTLRQWMNDEFYNNAFDDIERQYILTSYLKNEDNPYYRTEGGNDTEDKVFALSLKEAEQYLGIADYYVGSYWRSALPALSSAEVTAYAEAKGAYITTDGHGWWCLRSPGSFDSDAAYIDGDLIALGSYDGVLYVGGNSVVRSSHAVRPALWLNLNP